MFTTEPRNGNFPRRQKLCSWPRALVSPAGSTRALLGAQALSDRPLAPSSSRLGPGRRKRHRARFQATWLVGAGCPFVWKNRPRGRKQQYRTEAVVRAGRRRPYTLLRFRHYGRDQRDQLLRQALNFLSSPVTSRRIARAFPPALLTSWWHNPSVTGPTVFPELIAYPKANPGRNQHGIARQPGTGLQLAGERIQEWAARFDMFNVRIAAAARPRG